MTDLTELLVHCEACDIRLRAGSDGRLTVNSPQGAVTPEIVARLKTHKTELLAVLRQSNETVAIMPIAIQKASPTSGKALCRCGATERRTVPIHNGQSLRRDCGRCGRFVEFLVWYGKDTGQNDQH